MLGAMLAGRRSGRTGARVEAHAPHRPLRPRRYQANGATQQAQALTEQRGGGGSGFGGGRDKRCTLASIRDENLGHSGKPDWVTVR